MSSTTIQRIIEDAQRKNIFAKKQDESMKWIYERARRTNINASKFIREEGQSYRNTTQLKIGALYFWGYSAKWKEELPYWDLWPMGFLTDLWKDKQGNRHPAFINLHYLPYRQRAMLLDALLDLENNAKVAENKKLLISYGIMKKASTSKWFAPTYHRYLRSHFRTRLVRIPYEEWKYAVFLPLQEFQTKDTKISNQSVWAESLRKLAKHK